MLVTLLESDGYEVEATGTSDEAEEIAGAMLGARRGRVTRAHDRSRGRAQRDVTPEADALGDRSRTGIAEAIRADSLGKSPHAPLARSIRHAPTDARRRSPRVARRLPRACRACGPRSGTRCSVCWPARDDPQARHRARPPVSLPRQVRVARRLGRRGFALPVRYMGMLLAVADVALRLRTGTRSRSRSSGQDAPRWA